MKIGTKQGALDWSELPALPFFRQFCHYFLDNPFFVLRLGRVCKNWRAEVLNLSAWKDEALWKRTFFNFSLPRVGMGIERIATWRLLVYVHRSWRRAKCLSPLDIPKGESFICAGLGEETFWRNSKGQFVVRNGAETITPFAFEYMEVFSMGDGYLVKSFNQREVGFWSPTGCHYRSSNKFPYSVLETPSHFGLDFMDAKVPTQAGKTFENSGKLWLEENKPLVIWQQEDPLPRIYKEGTDKIYVGYERGLVRVFDKETGKCLGEIALPTLADSVFLAVTKELIFVGVKTNECELHILESSASGLKLKRSIKRVLDCQIFGHLLKIQFILSSIEREEFPHALPKSLLKSGSALINPERPYVKDQAFYQGTYLWLFWSNQQVEILNIKTGESRFIPFQDHEKDSAFEVKKGWYERPVTMDVLTAKISEGPSLLYPTQKWEWEWKKQIYKFEDNYLFLPSGSIKIAIDERVTQLNCIENKLLLVTVSYKLYCFDIDSRSLQYVCNHCKAITYLGKILQVTSSWEIGDIRYFQIS